MTINTTQIVNYLPQGAVAPSEATGVQFDMEMAADALNYHQFGDEDDAPCCTAENPCATRIEVQDRLSYLMGQTPNTQTVITTESETRARTQAAGSTRRPVADPASEAQISFIQTLVTQRETDQIGTFPARTLREIQEGLPVSKSRASSLITALKAAKVREDAPIQAGPAATPAQIALIQKMADEQGRTLHSDLKCLTKEAASDLITYFMERRDNATSTKPEVSSISEGMYRTPDGEIYKVQVAVHGSGRLYAKKLVELDEPRQLRKGTRTHEFAYAEGALRKLTPEMKMTLEQAKEWGSLYGTCCKCGLVLTKEESIEAGIGPVCSEGF